MPIINGTPQNDIIIGTAEDDIISAGAGSDTVRGNEGNDRIDGGDGNDNLQGDSGADIVLGGGGDDVLQASAFGLAPDLDIDRLSGGAGNDSLYGGYGDILDGGDSIYDYAVVNLAGATAGVTLDLSTFQATGNLTSDATTLIGVEYIRFSGTRFDDTLIIGNNGVATIYQLRGGEGADTLISTGAATEFYSDVLTDPRADVDTMIGGPGNDLFYGGYGDNINGGGGFDQIDFLSLNGAPVGVVADFNLLANGGSMTIGGGLIRNIEYLYTVYGTYFDDVLTKSGGRLEGLDGNDILTGSAGSEQIKGGTGRDILDGGDGDDILAGFTTSPLAEADADTLLGGNGDDILYAGINDDVDGGSGYDELTVYLGGATSGVFLDLRDAMGSAGATNGNGTIRNIETVIAAHGSAFGDYLILGSNGGSTISSMIYDTLAYGEGGDDRIDGGSRRESIYGGSGADVLNGGDGNDILHGGSADIDTGWDIDTLNGQNGDDKIYAGVGDHIDGGGGRDEVWLDLGASGSGLTVDLNAALTGGTSIVAGGVILSVEILWTLTATAFDDVVLLGATNGSTTIDAGAGNDYVEGSSGANIVYGRAGTDLIYGNGGNDQLFGDDGDDALFGGDGDDRIDGGAGYNKLDGGAGSDTVSGGDDSDRIRGGDGNDYLLGGAGDDLLLGGPGQDEMRGGTGADKFRFLAGDIASVDRILDFSQAQGDRIMLGGIDAIAGGQDDAFTFIGTTAFGGTVGELRYEVIGGNTYVMGDINGDRTADFSIRLDGVIPLAAGDFGL